MSVGDLQTSGASPRPAVERRLSPRFEARYSTVLIDGATYDVVNLSHTGMLIGPYAGGHESGDSFGFRITVVDGSFDFLVEGGATVQRADAMGLAVKFFHIDPRDRPEFDQYLDWRLREAAAGSSPLRRRD